MSTFHQTCYRHKVSLRTVPDQLFRTGGVWTPIVIMMTTTMTMMMIIILIRWQNDCNDHRWDFVGFPDIEFIAARAKVTKTRVGVCLAWNPVLQWWWWWWWHHGHHEHYGHLHLAIRLPIDVLDIMGALSVTVASTKSCSHLVACKSDWSIVSRSGWKSK